MDLSVDNILDVKDFLGDYDLPGTDSSTTEEKEEKSKKSDSKKDASNSDNDIPFDAKIGDFFGNSSEDEDGDNDDNNKKGSKSSDISSNNDKLNNYQGLLKSLIEDGVFSDEDEDVKDAESFKSYIDKQVTQRLEDYQQEIKRAMEAGVDNSEIQLYQQAQSWLRSYTTDVMEGLSKEAQQMRANLIYRDYLNRGFSEQKAKNLTMSSVKEGNDIEDAKEALDSVRAFFDNRYNSMLEQAEQLEQQRLEYIKKQEEDLKKNLLEKENLFGSIKIDKATRQKAYSAMTKIVARKDDEEITEVQKFADDNPVEFRTVIGLMYAMTDGFKSFDKLFNKAVDKKVNSKLDEFTKTITSQPHSDKEGSISYKNGYVKELYDRGWKPLI